MATLVQHAKNFSVTALPPSITGGSGTRGLAAVTVTFANPITAGNDILLSIMGDVQVAASVVTLGGILGFINYGGGGSLPGRTYWFGLTYTDASGRETMLGPVGSIFVPANNLVRVVRPNVEDHSGHPGFSGFSIYASTSGPTGLKLVSGAANLDPVLPQSGNNYWQEPTSGLVLTATNPPTTPAQDTLGNTYVQCGWIDQFEGGSNTGNNAMGFYVAHNSPAGANAVKFVCAVFNSNTAVEFDGTLSVIACEVTPMGNTIASGYQKLHAGVGDISVALVDSNSATRTTDWGIRAGNTGMVVDLSPAPASDSFFAMFCNTLQFGATDPPTPTLTASAYTFVDSQVANLIPHWLWFFSQGAPPATTAWLATES